MSATIWGNPGRPHEEKQEARSKKNLRNGSRIFLWAVVLLRCHLLFVATIHQTDPVLAIISGGRKRARPFPELISFPLDFKNNRRAGKKWNFLLLLLGLRGGHYDRINDDSENLVGIEKTNHEIHPRTCSDNSHVDSKHSSPLLSRNQQENRGLGFPSPPAVTQSIKKSEPIHKTQQRSTTTPTDDKNTVKRFSLGGDDNETHSKDHVDDSNISFQKQQHTGSRIPKRGIKLPSRPTFLPLSSSLISSSFNLVLSTASAWTTNQFPHHFYKSSNRVEVENDIRHSPSTKNNRARNDFVVPVTVCQAKGARPYMEDEYVVGQDCVAIFDGHGGRSVSRFLRQNLLAELQRAITAVKQSRAQVLVDPLHPNDATDVQDLVSNTDSSAQEHELTQSRQPQQASWLTVDDCICALAMALDQLDRDVQKISHWSFQGSTAVVAWLHIQETMIGPREGSSRSKSKVRRKLIHGRGEEEAEDAIFSQRRQQPARLHSMKDKDVAPETITTVIVANVGDSRAVLCRRGRAVALTLDHKPDHVKEYQRIISMGGRVTCSSSGGGIPRVNGNLALSRAIGDRAERPFVTAQPDIFAIPIYRDAHTHQGDDFAVLATDGLWDVMTNSQVVNFVLSTQQRLLADAASHHDNLHNDCGSSVTEDLPDSSPRVVSHLIAHTNHAIQKKVTELLVLEALRRGSSDNISVLILWLKS